MRRAFLAAEEIPRLLQGAFRGHAVTLRRLLGARRAGRIGLALGLLGLLAASPWPWVLPLIAGHLMLAGVGLLLVRSQARLGLLDYLRLSLWTAPLWLVAAAVLRPFWPASPLASQVAIVLGHLTLLRGLRRGLD
jgi:hypothetical protein